MCVFGGGGEWGRVLHCRFLNSTVTHEAYLAEESVSVCVCVCVCGGGGQILVCRG